MLGDSGVEAKKTFANAGSVLFDAVCVLGGASSVETPKKRDDPAAFVAAAYKHGKAIAVTGEGVSLAIVALPNADHSVGSSGIVTHQSGSGWAGAAKSFVAALAK